MNRGIFAIILTDNKRLLVSMLIVPLVLTVVLPTVFIITICMAPQEAGDLHKLMEILPTGEQGQDLQKVGVNLVLNYILPVFFLIIPVMAASIMAASSFVGEKEKHTLETLLYCPLSLRQLFQAKVLASFGLSMFVSLLSFIVMLVVLEAELYFAMGAFLWPDVKWFIVMLVVSPAIALIAITLIVRVSAKAKGVEEAQQGAVFLLLPVVALIGGQFSGLLLVNVWILLGIGVVCAVLAFVLLRRSMGNFRYETLLK